MRCFLGLALLLSLVPRAAPAQSPILPASSGYDLDRTIAEYEDTLRKIRDQKWIWIPVPDAGAFISPEAEAGLFSHAILLGTVHPDSVAPMHRRFREMTRTVQAEIEKMLEGLYVERQRRDQGPPPTRILPNEAQGIVRGTWAVPCWRDGVPLSEGGTFSLRLVGDGTAGGTYVGPSGSFGVGGRIDDAGNIEGRGSHPDGAFSFTARIEMSGATPRLLGGTVHFEPSNSDVSCAGGKLLPAGPA